MKTRTTVSLFALGLLLACDEPPPSLSETDTSEADAADAGGDVAVEDISETDAQTDASEEDAEQDAQEDAGADADPSDTAGTDALGDVDLDVSTDTSEDVVEDTSEDVEVEDAGTACGDEPTVCVAPYTCMDEVCRIPLAGTTWAESSFEIVEPEELQEVFNTFKAFTGDVRFLVMDIGEGESVLGVRYGAADMVEGESELPLLSFQQGGTLTGNAILRAQVDAERPLDGSAWITDTFLYELRAIATIELGGPPVTAGFGLDAEEVRITMTVGQEDDPTLARGRLVGLVTRAETEQRSMLEEDELPAFRTLYCERGSTHDPGGTWHLSDVLDCNSAVMDADADGDGINDAYVVVIDAVFERAILIDGE